MCKIKGVKLFLQVFVSNILIFLVEAEPITFKELVIFDKIKPFHYKLELWLHIESNFYVGTCRILIHIEEEIERISFLSTVSVRNAKLVKKDSEEIGKTYIPKNIIHHSVANVVILYFDKTIRPGLYGFEVHYQNNFTDSTETDGFIRTSCIDVHGNKRWMVTTQTREGCPRAIIPCWKEPRFKTSFKLSINHPSDYVAISNSKRHCFSPSEPGMTWTHFESTSSIIFPHCLSIVVMPPYQNHLLGYNISVWMLYDDSIDLFSSVTKFQFAEIIFKNVTHYLKTLNLVDHCNVPYINYIAIRNFSLNKIITTPSFVLFREEDVTVPDTSLLKHKQEIETALVIIEQIVYQWILRSTSLLGCLVFSWMQDVSKLLTVYLLEKIFPDFKVHNWPIQTVYKHEDARFTRIRGHIVRLDPYENSTFVFKIENIIKFIIFSRTSLAYFCNTNSVSALGLES